MDAKEYLQQAYRLNELIDSDLEELNQLRHLSTGIPSVDVSKERVQGGVQSHDKIGNVVAKIDALERKINDEIDQFVDLKDEIRTVINEVPDNDEKLLLRYRHINFYSWDEIYGAMKMSKSTVHRLYASALSHVIVPNKETK